METKKKKIVYSEPEDFFKPSAKATKKKPAKSTKTGTKSVKKDK